MKSELQAGMDTGKSGPDIRQPMWILIMLLLNGPSWNLPVCFCNRRWVWCGTVISSSYLE